MCNFGIIEELCSHGGKPAAIVKPYLSDSCMGCTNKCGKFGKKIVAMNSRGLDLHEKQTVRIRVSRIQFFVQGFLSLLLPISFGFLGFFLSPGISSFLFSQKFAENHFQAISFIIVLIFFILSSALVFFLSRADFTISRPEIDEIILSE